MLKNNKILINKYIRAFELRIIDENNKNIGVMSKENALSLAKSKNLDLIEVSPETNPPVARIYDYGKYQYDISKKEKESKSKTKATETKTVQITINISAGDIILKSKHIAEWLNEGHRIKIEMEVKGRSKSFDDNFIKDRLNRLLAIIPADYKIAEPFKKMPKSIFVVLEKKR